MASASYVDLISCIPGDYVIRRQAYDRAEDFCEELDWTQRFCQSHGFFFEAVKAAKTNVPEAFFVHIR